jgi:hypothetical protein
MRHNGTVEVATDSMSLPSYSFRKHKPKAILNDFTYYPAFLRIGPFEQVGDLEAVPHLS